MNDDIPRGQPRQWVKYMVANPVYFRYVTGFTLSRENLRRALVDVFYGKRKKA